MMENFLIEPLKGYGDFQFGMSIDEVVESLGQPSNQEEIESAYDDGNHIIVLDYEDFDLSMYFEGDAVQRLANFYTYNENSVLFGAKIFDLNKDQLIELMKENGYEGIKDMTDERILELRDFLYHLARIQIEDEEKRLAKSSNT